MRRSDRYLHVPDYPWWYILGPSFVLLIAIGLFASGVTAICLHLHSTESKYGALPLGLIAIALQSYIVTAELRPSIYNYDWILIPDGFIMVGFLVLALCIAPKFSTGVYGLESNDKATDIVVMSLCLYGWALSLVYIVVVGIAVNKHRSCLRDEGEMDLPVKPRVRTSPVVENEDTSVKDNVDGARKSVHYNFADPYHPLRMHPVDSTSTIKTVPPEMTDGKVEASESKASNARPRIAAPPAAYRLLPPRAA